MNDLIKISNDQMVDARELHSFLGIGTRFDIWIKRRIEEYAFMQGTDFVVIKNDHSEIMDLRISIDMAKEICMVEKTERGKQARLYFIEVEKRWRSEARPRTTLEALQGVIAVMVDQERKTLANTRAIETLQRRVDLQASDSGYRTVRAMAKERGIKISESSAARIGKRAKVACSSSGAHVGKVADERHGSVNSYPVDILSDVFEKWSND